MICFWERSTLWMIIQRGLDRTINVFIPIPMRYFTAHSNFSPMYSSIHLFFDDPGRAPPTSAGLIAYLPNPFVFENHKDREQVTFQPNLHCNKHGRSARNPRFGSCQPCKRNVDAHIKQSRSMTNCSKRLPMGKKPLDSVIARNRASYTTIAMSATPWPPLSCKLLAVRSRPSTQSNSVRFRP